MSWLQVKPRSWREHRNCTGKECFTQIFKSTQYLKLPPSFNTITVVEFWNYKWMHFPCQSLCFLFYFYMCVWWWRGEVLRSSEKGVGFLATGMTGSCGSSDLGAGNQTPAQPVRLWERFHPIVPLWKVIQGLSFRHAIFLNLSSFLCSGKKVEGITNNSTFVWWAF